MDIYHGWCDLKPGIRDMEFVEAFTQYMEMLEQEGVIAGWRLMRKKLGLAPKHLGEFHFMIEVTDLTQLDSAFDWVATRADPVEIEHFSVNSLVENITFALYRDFPDPVRERGEERF
ncbi:MAG: hypothetical protein GC184_04410 [Rhizobiales bacterium]|nr:hypothetical protein [Hyphomicrobiales bacterium]